MKITVRALNEVTVLDLVGNMKSPGDMEDFSRALNEELERKNIKLLLNFQEVGFINSSGLGRIVLAAKKVGDCNGILRVMNLSHDLDELFSFTRLKDKIGVYKDEATAIASFQ